MNKLCNSFNRYQDGELSQEEQEQFAQHMAICSQCRIKHYFLNNLARTFKSQKLPESGKTPEQISRITYQRLNSWDVFSLYLPKPVTVWAAFAFLLILFSFVWIAPSVQKSGINAEYEMLITDSDLSNLSQNILITPTDDEILRWLEQGGEIQ